ncbi:S-adenosyl-L-methionine-dependent methyltransferase [Gonapodya prolifera JEL478]|uniref:S-adenosyl-L-methionine-dependent methyltransferase n=1 Tax=Gonapodya prolifera (strain JEL478) TaxID=1344416 RepID=A0A139AIQ1_GONPJ|nr:S-adenosyl-L-methionine-dependent methyltransferase [Gonapodya prolifera JEL478]|eukprot:KXS16618.1 S-adenosyl-L-methionine-dependent methyltransferase [Gonapodya prolifera JEL478]
MITSHQSLIQAEFTKQGANFATAPSIVDPSRIARLVAASNPKPTDRVVEFATGPGHVALGFAPHVKEIVGVDITEALLEIANRSKTDRGITNASFITGNVESPTGLSSLPSASFDIAVCRLAFHHFQNPAQALREMSRLVKPVTGRVVVQDVHGSGVDGGKRRDFQDEWETLRDPSHTKFLTLPELTTAFGECGLEVEVIQTDDVIQKVDRWFQTTQTPPESRAKVLEMLERDMKEDLSGARPYYSDVDGEKTMFFTHRMVTIVGRRIR